MKRFIFLASGALIILVVIMLIRTVMFTTKQIEVKPVSPVPLDERKMIQHLSGAIRIPTVSYQDPAKFRKEHYTTFHQYLERTFPLLHRKLKKEKVNSSSLLFTWNGSHKKAKPVIFIAHMDVVPIEPGTEKDWLHPPFSGKVKNGFVWGRGTMDMKGPLMATLEAVEYLLRKNYIPRRTIYLAFGHDEEIGGTAGAKKIADLLAARNIHCEYLHDEGGFITSGLMPGVTKPVAMVGIAEKGYLTVRLTVMGEGGHSSMPPKETAAGIVCTAVDRLQKNPFPMKITGVSRTLFEYTGPEMALGNRIVIANLWFTKGILKTLLSGSPSTAAMLHTTMAPTMLEGSVKENILPSKASAVINLRLLPGDSIDATITYLKKTINDSRVTVSIVGYASEPSDISDIRSWSFLTVQKTLHQVFPDAVVTPFLMIGGTDSIHYRSVTGAVYSINPVGLDSEDLKRIHGTNERIAVKDYHNLIRYYIQLIKNSDTGI